MPSYFPRHTVSWKVEEPAAFRKLTLSVVEMGLITGVVLRLYRALVLTHGANSWVYFGVTAAFGAMLLFGMSTAHLANFTIRHWLWRAPLFVALEIVGELLTSLALTAVHREPWGSGRATFGDWPPMAADLLIWRAIPVAVFTLILALVVQLVRVLLLRHEDRDHTLTAISEENDERVAAEEAGH
jgi:hypothetical protein